VEELNRGTFMSQDDDFEIQEARVKANFIDQAKRAIALRSRDREFHGLEREFMYLQSENRGRRGLASSRLAIRPLSTARRG
jgi:hypothetical protein